ncbi:MAG: FliI/YscN family ATPase [Mariniblastus sp.]
MSFKISDPELDQRLEQSCSSVPAFRKVGRLESVQGMVTVSLPASIGELVEIQNRDGGVCLAEVIGFAGDSAQIMPFDSMLTLQRSDRVVSLGHQMRIPVGFDMLGRVINSIGNPIDSKGEIRREGYASLDADPPNALTRRSIEKPFITGQRAIDGLLTMGEGQRVGLYAGSGVGKSTLLGQIARHSQADLNVVALIGERGREVLPFIKEALGEAGLARSIVIVSTANETPLARVRAAESAVAIADWFRAKDKSVFLMLDSLTRFAMAQRELGLMLGEPPTSRGYTPSVFQKLAVILERLGSSDRGSITGLLTVLVEGDDMNDPIADSTRSILDGHIVMDRSLANAGHFPAINVLPSASRLFNELADHSHKNSAVCVRQILARYEEVVDLVQVGAYQPGVSAATDAAISLYPEVCKFLQQELGSPNGIDQTKNWMEKLAKQWTDAVS